MTPTFTNLSGGTITNAVYLQIGKTVFFRFLYTLAGAGVAGSVTFTLPVTARDYGLSGRPGKIGGVTFVDSGTADVPGECDYNSTTEGLLVALNTASTYLTRVGLSSTIPFTWANNDKIFVQGFYEAA